MTQTLHKETNDEIASIAPAPIVITDAAAQKVWELIQEEGNPNLMLRAYVMGGGCSGFQYGFTFEESIGADDTVIEKQINEAMIKLLVDAMSFQYLAGSKIDYRKSLAGEEFVIIGNPNAQTTCGCGSSFAA